MARRSFVAGAQNRPSIKELNGKLRLARELLSNDCWLPAEVGKLASNFSDLELFTNEEQEAGLRHAFEEISADDYDGGRPPMRSYEPATRDLEMFAFCWESSHFGRHMYVKFSIACPNQDATLYIHSLHQSTRGKGIMQ